MLLNEIINHKSTLQVYAALEVFEMRSLLMRPIPNPIRHWGQPTSVNTFTRASTNTTIRANNGDTWGSVLVRDLLQIDRIVESVMTVSRFFNERDYALDQELLPRLLDLRSLSLVHEFVGNFEDICLMVLERIEYRLMKQLEQWVEAGYIEQQYDSRVDHTAGLSKNTMVLHSPSLFGPIDSQAAIALTVVEPEFRVSLAEIATSLLHRFDVDPKESQIALPAVTLFTQYSMIVDLLQQSLRTRPSVKHWVIHQQLQRAKNDECGLHSAWKFLPVVMDMVKKNSRLQKMTIRHCVLKQSDSYRQVAVYFAQKLALKEYYDKCIQAIDKTITGDEARNVATLDDGDSGMDNRSAPP
ncbi:hypothetical protein BGZ58_006067 [Dissophora ornata]|nr:hypothetical protein BGZ58_006067 [Dissophora ornata]